MNPSCLFTKTPESQSLKVYMHTPSDRHGVMGCKQSEGILFRVDGIPECHKTLPLRRLHQMVGLKGT